MHTAWQPAACWRGLWRACWLAATCTCLPANTHTTHDEWLHRPALHGRACPWPTIPSLGPWARTCRKAVAWRCTALLGAARPCHCLMGCRCRRLGRTTCLSQGSPSCQRQVLTSVPHRTETEPLQQPTGMHAWLQGQKRVWCGIKACGQPAWAAGRAWSSREGGRVNRKALRGEACRFAAQQGCTIACCVVLWRPNTCCAAAAAIAVAGAAAGAAVAAAGAAAGAHPPTRRPKVALGRSRYRTAWRRRHSPTNPWC